MPSRLTAIFSSSRRYCLKLREVRSVWRTSAVVPASLFLLFFAGGDVWQLVAIALLLGASQGVITMVRSAVPLALFGVEGYGTVLGLTDAGLARQRPFTGRIRFPRRSVQLAGIALCAVCVFDRHVDRHRVHVAVV